VALVVKTKQDDSLVWISLAVNLGPKVLVIGNQDSALGKGLADNLIVIKTASLFVYRKDIMALLAQLVGHYGSGAFIDEKSHSIRLRLQGHESRILKGLCRK
jgi:hypothetical protein